MKRIFLIIILFLLTTQTFSQNTFPNTGNSGIGTVNPQASLDIVKSYDASQTKALKMFYSGSWGYQSYAKDFRFLDIESSEEGKILQLNAYGMGLGYNPPGYASPDKLYINGNVGIGTETPREKLSVNGKIRAKEIKVETANWPDYVFSNSYHLPTLQETEKHIKEKGHLPGIPTAEEVNAHGIALGEMNAKLLQKIEELTLHIIELSKTVQKQQNEINNLK
jgi:hypothetical protein